MAQVNWQLNPVGAVFARLGGEMPQGTFKFINDGYEVYTLVCADKSFQPASLFYGENNSDKQKVDTLAPEGKVPTSMNCFVVKTINNYIMFDTGLPVSKGGKTLERLASLKISQEEITDIYITHSHFDHIGGLIDEAGKAVYPKAKIYSPAVEFSFMKDTMKEMSEQILAAYADKIIIFEPGEILPNNVLPISAKGHTPGHTAYRLGNLLFAGDIMHGEAVQLIDPTINANYDADRVQVVATRLSLLSYAAANSLTVLGAHIPNNGVIF